MVFTPKTFSVRYDVEIEFGRVINIDCTNKVDLLNIYQVLSALGVIRNDSIPEDFRDLCKSSRKELIAPACHIDYFEYPIFDFSVREIRTICVTIHYV